MKEENVIPTIKSHRKGVFKKRIINIGTSHKIQEPFSLNVETGESLCIKEGKNLQLDEATITYLGDYDIRKHGKYNDIFYYAGTFKNPSKENKILRRNPYWRWQNNKCCPLLLNYTIIVNILGRQYRLQIMKGPTFSIEDVTKGKRKKKVNSWRGSSLHEIWNEVVAVRSGLQQYHQPYKYFGFESKLVQDACINIIAQKGNSASQLMEQSVTKEQETTYTINDFIREKHQQNELNISYFEPAQLLFILEQKQKMLGQQKKKIESKIEWFHEEQMMDKKSPETIESTSFETSAVLEEYTNEDTAHHQKPGDVMEDEEDETTNDEASPKPEETNLFQQTPISQKFTASQLKTPTRTRQKEDSQDIQLPPSCVLSPQRKTPARPTPPLPTQEPTQVLHTPRHMRVRSQPISTINRHNVLELFYSFPLFNIPIKQVEIAPYQDYIVLCVLTSSELFVFRYENSGEDQFEFRLIASITAAEHSEYKRIGFHRQLLSLWCHTSTAEDEDEMDLSIDDSSLAGDFLSFYTMEEVFVLSQKSGIYFSNSESIQTYQLYQHGSNYFLLTTHKNGTLKLTKCDFKWKKIQTTSLYEDGEQNPFHTLRVVGEELYAASSTLVLVWNIYKNYFVSVSRISSDYLLKDIVVLSTVRQTFLALTYTIPSSDSPTVKHCGLFGLHSDEKPAALRFIHQYSSNVTTSNNISKYLVCGTTMGSIELYNAVTGDKVGVLYDLASLSTQLSSNYPATSVSFHPYHAYMATASSRTICIYSQHI